MADSSKGRRQAGIIPVLHSLWGKRGQLFNNAHRRRLLLLYVLQAVAWVVYVAVPSRADYPWWLSLLELPITGAAAVVLAIIVARAKEATLTQAVFFLANAFLVVLLLASEAYWGIGDSSNFTDGSTSGFTGLSKLGAVYFALGALTTAGAGNLSATSDLGRGFISIQLVIDVVLTGFALTAVATRVSEMKRSTKETAESAGTHDPEEDSCGSAQHDDVPTPGRCMRL